MQLTSRDAADDPEKPSRPESLAPWAGQWLMPVPAAVPLLAPPQLQWYGQSMTAASAPALMSAHTPSGQWPVQWPMLSPAVVPFQPWPGQWPVLSPAAVLPIQAQLPGQWPLQSPARRASNAASPDAFAVNLAAGLAPTPLPTDHWIRANVPSLSSVTASAVSASSTWSQYPYERTVCNPTCVT